MGDGTAHAALTMGRANLRNVSRLKLVSLIDTTSAFVAAASAALCVAMLVAVLIVAAVVVMASASAF